MKEYIKATKSIDYMDPDIQKKVQELLKQTESSLDYIKKAYLFVRDEIKHSWDIRSDVVSRTASDVLKNKTGICWTKACLLAALLRANNIPSGIGYQLLTRADDNDRDGYIVHALNTVYIEEQAQWIRLDARGNKENVHAEFSLEKERLAYPVRTEYGEIDYRDNNSDLDERLIKILEDSNNILEIRTDFKMQE